MAAVTQIAKIVDAIHADTSTTYKVTKVKVNQSKLNDIQTEFNKLTGSSDDITNLLGIPVEVDSTLANDEVKYERDFISNQGVTLTLS